MQVGFVYDELVCLQVPVSPALRAAFDALRELQELQ
jgi:hypothetical protein